MIKYFLTIFIPLCMMTTANAQIEAETEFKYIKAKYLLETERYEDAIKAFTDLLKEESSYKDALLLRGEAKYQMAAYKGTKQDVLEYASYSGIDAHMVQLLGLADYKLGNADAALNSLLLAAQLDDANARTYEVIGDIYKGKDQLLKACEFWKQAAFRGSSKARINASKICGDSEPIEEKKEEEAHNNDPMHKQKEPTKTDGDSTTVLSKPTKDDVLKDRSQTEPSPTGQAPGTVNEEGNTSTEKKEEEVPPAPEEEENLPDEDDTPYEVVIDSDLTLVIYGQGLGKRKVLNQPNILFISDEDGTVAIDICVNNRGKVELAELNKEKSTILNKGLVSLAIRKAKDFWFEKNDYKEQCGVILFKVKA